MIVVVRSIFVLVTEKFIHGMDKQAALAESEVGSALAALAHLHHVV